MNIEEVVSNMLTGEPVHDGVVIGIIFICFYAKISINYTFFGIFLHIFN